MQDEEGKEAVIARADAPTREWAVMIKVKHAMLAHATELGGLVALTRKRQGDKLSRMAGSIVAAASTGTPISALIADHQEWWQRGSPTKKPTPKAAPMNASALV